MVIVINWFTCNTKSFKVIKNYNLTLASALMVLKCE